MKKKQEMTLGVAFLLIALTAVGADSEREKDGLEAYRDHCASCHETGANDAPSIQNPKDWAGRSNLWEAVLFEHANKGYLKMPAKGGDPSMSEYEVDAAAEYMLNITHPDYPAD